MQNKAQFEYYTVVERGGNRSTWMIID